MSETKTKARAPQIKFRPVEAHPAVVAARRSIAGFQARLAKAKAERDQVAAKQHDMAFLSAADVSAVEDVLRRVQALDLIIAGIEAVLKSETEAADGAVAKALAEAVAEVKAQGMPILRQKLDRVNTFYRQFLGSLADLDDFQKEAKRAVHPAMTPLPELAPMAVVVNTFKAGMNHWINVVEDWLTPKD